MPRKRRNPKTRRAEIPANVLAYLKDDFSGSPEVARNVRAAVYFNDIAAWWGLMKDEILEDWAREQPGTRPRAWWEYNSKEPRRRLGGTGEPDHGGNLQWGLPRFWTPNLRGVAIDPEDPPRFESEAAYLKRCGLLLPGELVFRQ